MVNITTINKQQFAKMSLPNGVVNIKENNRLKEIETTNIDRLILLVLFNLEKPISILQIKHTLIKKLNKDISIPTFYSSLDRMKINKLVDYKYSEKENNKGGRVKKIFYITEIGKKYISDLINNIKLLAE